MPSNQAAYLDASDGSPLRVASAPYTSPSTNQITIKNHALGINPIDGYLQMRAFLPGMFHPAIMGFDVAGEVVETGPGVTAARFKPGDRVLGSPIWFHKKDSAQGGFQNYTVLATNMASKIPDHVSYEQAAAVPLGLSTAASGMFQKDFLAMEFPSLNPVSKGKTLLVWGGATSVGTSAIQLAKAAGYDVVATASAKNFEMCRRLGASYVVDYNSPTVVDELVAAFKGRECVGVLDTANRDEKIAVSCEVVSKLQGRKFVASCGSDLDKLPEGVELKRVFGSSAEWTGVGEVIFGQYLPEAMKQGKFVAEPQPDVVGKGLESLQKALEIRRAGNVSAKKIVVTL